MSIIDELNRLKPGERLVYLVNDTGWSGRFEHRELFNWCQDAQKKGTYDFVQRKIDVPRYAPGLFEYIAIKKAVPKPSIWRIE